MYVLLIFFSTEWTVMIEHFNFFLCKSITNALWNRIFHKSIYAMLPCNNFFNNYTMYRKLTRFLNRTIVIACTYRQCVQLLILLLQYEENISRNILQLIPGVCLVIKHSTSNSVKMMILLLMLKYKRLWRWRAGR